jgi:hypothetical protein
MGDVARADAAGIRVLPATWNRLDMSTWVTFRSLVAFVVAFAVSAWSLKAWREVGENIGSLLVLGLLLTGVVLVFPYVGSSLANLWTRGSFDQFGDAWARWGAYCLSAAPDSAQCTALRAIGRQYQVEGM